MGPAGPERAHCSVSCWRATSQYSQWEKGAVFGGTTRETSSSKSGSSPKGAKIRWEMVIEEEEEEEEEDEEEEGGIGSDI